MILPKGQRMPQGNAQAADVLAGKTFESSGSFVQKTGTITDQSGTSSLTTWSNSDSDAVVYVTVPKGYFPGGEQNLRVQDINLVAANIMGGIVLFGVVGTATTDADATASDIRTGKTAYVAGQKITGTATF